MVRQDLLVCLYAKNLTKTEATMKIVLLLLEIFVICYMGCLFFQNRHAKQILTISLNIICIGLAFTLLSLVLSSPEIRFSLESPAHRWSSFSDYRLSLYNVVFCKY